MAPLLMLSVPLGLTVSILTVSDLVVWFVALSVAWQSIRCVPSPVTLIVQVSGPMLVRTRSMVPSLQLGELALRPELPSLAVAATVSREALFQPLSPPAAWQPSR